MQYFTEAVMRRFSFSLAIFFALLWPVFSCSGELTEDIDFTEDEITDDEITEPDDPGPVTEVTVFLGCTVISETEINYRFSKPVKAESISFEPVLVIDSIEEGNIVIVYLEEVFKNGIRYMADILVTDEQGIELRVQVPFETKAPPLDFHGYSVISETEIEFDFSAPVIFVSFSVNPVLEIDTIEEGIAVKVYFYENLKPGQKLAINFCAEDEFGQTVNKSINTQIENNRVPHLLINELRTEYSKPRVEFIEFKMITGGNLGGLKVFIAGNYKEPMVFEFLPVEVAEGEYVVLHLRTLEEVSVNEYGSDLGESGGTDSSPSARDFWIPGSVKLLHKTDAVYISGQNGQVLDAVMISETPDTRWQKDYLGETAEFLFRCGAWQTPEGTICSPAEAVSTAEIKTAATRSISRDEKAEDTNTAADWFTAGTGGATPGKPNIAR